MISGGSFSAGHDGMIPGDTPEMRAGRDGFAPSNDIAMFFHGCCKRLNERAGG